MIIGEPPVIYQPAQAHANCMFRKPDGTIVLYVCPRNDMLRKRAKPKRAPKIEQPQQRKILVVPTGRELDI